MTRREREAADWATKMRGTPSDSERKAFETWRAKAGNADAYAQAEGDWAYTRGLSPKRIKEDSRRIRGEANSPGSLRWAMATIAAVVLALGAAWYAQHQGDEPQLALKRSAAGEQVLGDGTRVTLMDGAEIETRFSTERRLVILTGGRARFEVAHEAARPFTVIAGGSETTALGTIFEVDAREMPRVALIEGIVEVRSRAGGEALRLAPGEVAEVPETGPRRLAAMAGPSSTPPPLPMLAADNLPLGAVIDRANMTDTKHIRLADPALGALPVTGRFDVSAGAALARKLAAALDLRIDERANEIILSKN